MVKENPEIDINNVIMMNFSFSQVPDIILKLMFVEPGQFNLVGNATP